MNNPVYYTASNVFNGYEMLHDHAVAVEQGAVTALMPAVELPAGAQVHALGDVILAPAFIDLQLYGANKRLLAVYPDTDTVADIVAYCIAGGAAWCQPTVATNTYATIFRCIDAVRLYVNGGGKGVIGLHVEGPWLSKEKRGAHIEECIFSPTVQQAKELLEYGKGVISMITLAPEVCSREIIDLVQSYGVVVSAGHSNATYAQATESFNAGIHTATHLFNAMSPLQHRAPGMAGAILDHPTVACSIVPDGHHVDFAVIRIAQKVMGQRLFAITDAVTETSEGYYRHTYEGDKYTSNGILSGSSLTMYKCFLNFVQECGINTEEALRMCSLYPARVMGLAEKRGQIKPGSDACFVVLGANLQFQQCITHFE